MKSRILLTIILFCLASYSNYQAQSINIIPRPQEIVWGNEELSITPSLKIISLNESNKTAVILKDYLMKLLGYKIDIISSNTKVIKSIKFIVKKNLSKEAYELKVTKQGIEIRASCNTGWFYGVQSLVQLFPSSQKSSEPSSINIPTLEIKDSPRFSWRAFMLDESRHFKGMDQVKMLLDEMAHLKMNIFHWHLVDDQGWRIEIKKYPKLTQIGSKRKSTQVGPLYWNSPIQSAEPHEGYYTQEEIREIVKYAEERHITIVPEIEMPGHSSAAIASYPWLGTSKKNIEVPIKFGKMLDTYDVSDRKVYQFLTDVLDETMELFPSNVIHIGGDEVKYDHWKASEKIKTYMSKNELSTPAELQVFFTNRISQYLQSKGKRMMGWNEIMGHQVHGYQKDADTKSDQKLAKESIVHFWKGDIKLATQAASSGYEIVNSLHTNTYLDYGYKTISLEQAYNFDPIPEELEPKYHSKVIGTGCQMWGEWIPTNGHMHYQVFPRIAGYAEVGWTETKNKNFNKFKKSLKLLQKRWKKKGIYYASGLAEK